MSEGTKANHFPLGYSAAAVLRTLLSCEPCNGQASAWLLFPSLSGAALPVLGWQGRRRRLAGVAWCLPDDQLSLQPAALPRLSAVTSPGVVTGLYRPSRGQTPALPAAVRPAFRLFSPSFPLSRLPPQYVHSTDDGRPLTEQTNTDQRARPAAAFFRARDRCEGERAVIDVLAGLAKR